MKLLDTVDSAEANDRQQLKLLLVASRHHLSRGDVRSLIEYLEKEDFGFNVTLEFSDPSDNPELLIINAIIAANNKTKPLAASSLKNQIKGFDK